MKKNIIITILCIILILFTFSAIAYGMTVNPDLYEPNTIQAPQEITNKIGTIISVIKVIGTMVMVISLLLLGIKYMTGSVEEKAEYKKTMIPYLVGAIMFFAISQVLAIIISIANGINA